MSGRRPASSAVLRALLDHIHRDAPPGAYVSLMADEPGRPLYERHGFEVCAPFGSYRLDPLSMYYTREL